MVPVLAHQAPSAVPLLDVEAVLARLPAEHRARLLWAKRPIEVALSTLRTEPLDDDVVERATESIVAPLASLTAAFWSVVLNRDDLPVALVDDFAAEEAKLRAYLVEEEALDTVRWLVAFWKGFLSLAFGLAKHSALPMLHDEAALIALAKEPRFRPLYRCQLMFMAVLECRKRGDPPARAHELLDLAFLAMIEVRDLLRQDGFWAPIFTDETIAQRRDAALSYALALRESLTQEDWRALDNARMGNLR